MKPLYLAAAVLGLLVTGCVAPVGPVEVTRFHLPDTGVLGHGAITVEPAPGEDGASLEFRTYAAAVARQLTLIGYSEQVAQVHGFPILQKPYEMDALAGALGKLLKIEIALS